MSIDFQRIRDIFQSVAELPASERAVVLDRECAGETELRRRVEALLKAHDDSGELPAVEPLATKSPPQQEIPADELEQTIGYVQPVEPGLVFAGRYKLREKLGEGGMGVVFVADQIAPVQRRVALKVIRTGLDTRQLLARFEQERQALALMDHPNIAKVFDAGVDEAHRPYFAMELVKGLPLTKYCDEAKLSTRQRIELFIPVCQAVQHAHQKGIIHRDLKPSNILVGMYDGRPVPKVIDFGVAKVTGTRLTDQSVYTEIGSIIGTLEYMSPEQAELNNLDIDTRSDVYALGVILYELLTGTVPFSRKELEKAGLAEMLRVIKEEEPHKPSTKLSSSVKLPSIAASRQTEPKKLTALVKGELDWIVMKALEKDRGRRYETANGLGQDVQRYLTGEPVMAAPASTAYRLRKLIRRNKGPVIAGSMVFAALLIGMAGTTWGLFRAEYHRQIAEQNADKAFAAAESEKESKELAEAHFTLAKESVEKYLVTVTEDSDLKKADFHRLRKKLLESALPFYEKITEQKSDDTGVELRRGLAIYRLAIVRTEMGEIDAAVQDYGSVQSIFSQLCKKLPAVREFREFLADVHYSLGLLLADQRKHVDAEAAYRQAMDIQERLATEFPTAPEYRSNLARSHNKLGLLLVSLGNQMEAEASYRQAMDIQEKLTVDFPTVPEYRFDLVISHYTLGMFLAGLGKLPESEAAYRQAKDIQEMLATNFPTAQLYLNELAVSDNQLGCLLAGLCKPPETEADFRHAIDIQEKRAPNFPAVPEFRRELANSHRSLGGLLVGLAKQAEAEVAYRQAIDIQEKLVASFPKVPNYRVELARGHLSLGMLLMGTKKDAETEAIFRVATGILEKLTKDFPALSEFRSELALSRNCLGLLMWRLGKQIESEAAIRQALAIQEKLVADFPNMADYRKNLAGSHNNLGNLLKDLRKYTDSETSYRQALDIQEKLAADFPNVPEYRMDLTGSHNNLGNLLKDLGKHSESEATYRRALEVREKLAADFPHVLEYTVDLGGCFCDFGNLFFNRGDSELSLRWYEKAIATLAPVVAEETLKETAQQFLRNSHMNRALALDSLDRHSDAISDWGRALELDDGSLKNFLQRKVASSHISLGVAFTGQGKLADAEAAYRTAISILKKLSEDSPSVDEYVVDLGRSYVQFGIHFLGAGNAESALRSYETANMTLAPFLSHEPIPASVRQFLSIGHWGKAASLDALGRHVESISEWERALELDDGTAKVAISSGFAESSLRRCQKDKDATGCIAAATEFESLKQMGADELYKSSCFRAVCASVVLEDPKTSTGDADRLAKEQADLAMAWLHKAVEAGYDNVEHMKTDADLNALHERDDFKKLLEDLTKAWESKNE